ncbi:hypothetical protein FE257_008101 [Aspergillus nanangensis]|uniref:Major facilitator superfamily (MFS) profile domain-containing protein n=1 Tax=Aspergillus nanangensis TaxID=2582783 RepID=A0AAD4CNR3_ASPNN|nr:hypothetical protein FE257_008101 [Aspergillus nanangensis]
MPISKSSKDETCHFEFQLANVADLQSTHEERTKLLRKVDLILMPLMGLCYMLQLLDKLSLNFSSQLGLVQDLNLHGSQYSWTSSVFYFGYLFWTWPSCWLAVKLPLGKYLTVTVLVWGAILMCHGACQNFQGFMAARFFLGAAEAAIAPGFSLLVSMFYRRDEQPLRQSLWFAGNCIANVIGGVISYGIGHIHSSLATWRVLFLILGAITVGYSALLGMFLPDSPSKAPFLNDREKMLLIQRTMRDTSGGTDDGIFRKNQMFEALRDPQSWLLVFYTISVNICNGGITTFNSLLIGGFGFSPLQSLLLQMPLGGCQLAVLGVISITATAFRNCRIILMMCACSLSLVGMILIRVLDNSQAYSRLGGTYLAAVFASTTPMSLSLIASNVGGFTKKATVNAMLFIAYSLGNIVGPQLYLSWQAPVYTVGIYSTIAGFCSGIFFLICLLAYYKHDNRRRNARWASGAPDHLRSNFWIHSADPLEVRYSVTPIDTVNKVAYQREDDRKNALICFGLSLVSQARQGQGLKLVGDAPATGSLQKQRKPREGNARARTRRHYHPSNLQQSISDTLNNVVEEEATRTNLPEGERQRNILDLAFVLHPSHQVATSDHTQKQSPSSSDGQGGLSRQACRVLGISQDAMNKMIQLFFDNMVAINIFHQPSFAEKLSKISSCLELTALLAAMAGYASRFASLGSDTVDRQPAYFLDIAFTYINKSLMDYDDQVPPLCLIQALIVATHCRLTQGVRGNAWRSLGLCVSLIYELNLHCLDSRKASRAQDAPQWQEDEEKRRAFWAVWEMDVFASTIRRTPTAIDWNHMEVLLPVDNAHWFSGQHTASCFSCFIQALPSHLQYRDQYLAFGALIQGHMESQRQQHCSVYNIYVMTQLAYLMIYRNDAFILQSKPGEDGADWMPLRSSDTGNGARQQYYEAADRILKIVNQSCVEHIQYINPFLPSTIWLAAAVQLVRKYFTQSNSSQSLISSRFDVLHLTYRRCMEFWDIQTALLRNLELIGEQLDVRHKKREKDRACSSFQETSRRAASKNTALIHQICSDRESPPIDRDATAAQTLRQPTQYLPGTPNGLLSNSAYIDPELEATARNAAPQYLAPDVMGIFDDMEPLYPPNGNQSSEPSVGAMDSNLVDPMYQLDQAFDWPTFDFPGGLHSLFSGRSPY